MSQNLFLSNFYPLVSVLSSEGAGSPGKNPRLQVGRLAVTLALTLLSSVTLHKLFTNHSEHLSLPLKWKGCLQKAQGCCNNEMKQVQNFSR